MADSPDAFSWLQTVSSVASAIIAIITLVTVYIAATQLATQNRLYRLGLSRQAVGPWEPKVANTTLLGLRRRVYAPAISLTSLVKGNWKPRFTFPRGFPEKPNANDEEAGNLVQAGASWVNFMEALGLSPESQGFYEMQDASELVNRVVPMAWIGKDLVGICSILGFQSHEDKPSFKSPMPLPMQWSGPLGWLQFRSSASGCIAEFRRRMSQPDQILRSLHAYWEDYPVPCEEHFLRSRLWNSIGGLYLPDDKILYLGGTNRHEGPRDQDDAEDAQEVRPEELLQDITSQSLTNEEIMLKLFGKKKDRPKALQRDAERDGPGQARRADEHEMPESFEALLRGKLDTNENSMEVFRPCPGLLSVAINGELAYSRGLSTENCQEYDRKFVDKEDVDLVKYPHNLGELYMDETLFKLMKDALLLVKPDGFYFSPTFILSADIRNAYSHIEEQSNKLMRIYPAVYETPTAPGTRHPQPDEDRLRHAMWLCNELQRTRKTGRAVFSVDDMRLLAKVSNALKGIISPAQGPDGRDMVWAFICCPDLSRDIRESLSSVEANADALGPYLTAKVKCSDGWLDCASLPGMAALGDGTTTTTSKYRTPLVADGEYTGAQVLAALSDVFIAYYWIEKRWITDVAMYDATIPQSVTMC